MKFSIKSAPIFLALVATTGCATTNALNDRTLLYGQWLTSNPKVIPNIIIDNSNNWFMLLEGEDETDTLNFKYVLKGNKLTLYTGKLEVSKNIIQTLNNDILIYKRKGDNEVFYYSRKK